ncbi:MAG: PAS domain S-box protein [Hydrogenophaga sp.]|uniref:PAS domain S-box protein n=1 Tax=Hydrogenophaga sp. TaxID=1904254 RepID=UPI002ABA4A9E|nr:PAS domain S-box protein [Hydrogenophaga sp.]MDZ4103307.1 PAS domain S-box protein [Hydrogenophaga sp.]
MQSAPKTADESLRLDTLASLEILDTPADPVLDGLVRAAAQLIGCPISLVSLVDERRQWFKARQGLDAQETPRELAFCAHAILQPELFEICDAREDVRFSDNPLVTGEPHVIFYAGVPLRVDGHAMGTLCVIDHEPHRLTPEQRSLLLDLARSAEHWLSSQQTHLKLERADADRRNLFDHMGDGMLLLDRNFRVLEANRSTARMLGHSPDELRRMRLHDLLPASEHTRLTRTALHVLKGVERLADWQVLRRDGSSFMAEVSTRVVDEQRFVVVLRDITQRHAQEQEVRLLSMAVEQSAQSILITDLNGNIEYVNAAALSSSGYAMHEMLGRNPRMLQSGKTPRESYTRMWSQLLSGKPWRGLLFNRRKDGVEYVEEASITPIRDAHGQVTQYLALMLDVTEKRRLNEELERHRNQLEDLVEQRTVALVAARRAAEAASEAKSAFLATMSHEIRTPMNGVVGSIDLLQRSELSHYQRDLADTVSESALSLLAIIDDILDFSKIEAGQLTLESVPVALVRLTDSVCDALRPSAASRGVDMQVDVSPDVPDWVLSDAVRLRQILNNLLGNAIKFSAGTGRAGRVDLIVETCGPELADHVQLRVSDNGIGMVPEAVHRIFQPFVQAEGATTRRFGGTGLGLSICKRLIGLMGGWIEVASAPDQGATFTVTLPLQPVQAPRPNVDELPVTGMPSGPRFAMAGGPLVLVAEDNDINQKVISHQLALLGVAVEMASDGIDALARWRAGQATERHSLLLTDLHMPGIDGYTLAATIRSEEAEGARLPIVALSANALRGEIDRCRAAGMDDYLSKPVQLDQLGELLRRWLPLDDVHVPDSLHAMDCHEMDVFEIELGPMAFDDQALARLVGDDPVLLADFRQRFLLSALNTIDEMRRAASQNDMLALAGLAHRLKSSARATGAVALAVCCERIERAGPQCAAPQMHAHMAEMEDALADVMTRLGTHVGEQPSDMSH